MRFSENDYSCGDGWREGESVHLFETKFFEDKVVNSMLYYT